MFMRFMSDLHLEFDSKKLPRFTIPELKTDADTVLVLAGDIALAKRPAQYREFIGNALERFEHVIWVMGNHEHYGSSVQRSIPKILRNLGISKAMHEHGNLKVVENEVVSIKNVDFICTTLWTDMANNNPLAMTQAQFEMNDYKKIRTGDTTIKPGVVDDPYKRPLRPEDTVRWNRDAVWFLSSALAPISASCSTADKKVVVTHHAPSHQSIHPSFRSNILNYAYASPLDELVLSLKPDYWIHGHIHHTNDYNIGKTNILSNPRGYATFEVNPQFDPTWTIDLS